MNSAAGQGPTTLEPTTPETAASDPATPETATPETATPETAASEVGAPPEATNLEGVGTEAELPELSPPERIEQLERELAETKVQLDSAKTSEARAVKKESLEAELVPYQVELLKLQRHLEQNNRRMIVLFEGRDAAGKGGTIRRVTRFMNEKHYRVVALGKPTEEQRTQWYFQRYVAQFPHGGEMVLFDRSWYNRAMVEPVFGFCTDEEYRNFMRGVTGFEKDLVRQGTILLKLYFSVTKQEQARRFDRRRNDPLRQWKFSEIDMQAQEHWDDFTEMKYAMLSKTSTAVAPWTIIRSENKHLARLNAMRLILSATEYEDRDPNVDLTPDPKIAVPGSREIEIMEQQRSKTGAFRA